MLVRPHTPTSTNITAACNQHQREWSQMQRTEPPFQSSSTEAGRAGASYQLPRHTARGRRSGPTDRVHTARSKAQACGRRRPGEVAERAARCSYVAGGCGSTCCCCYTSDFSRGSTSHREQLVITFNGVENKQEEYVSGKAAKDSFNLVPDVSARNVTL